jgi:hypothetical protein
MRRNKTSEYMERILILTGACALALNAIAD